MSAKSVPKKIGYYLFIKKKTNWLGLAGRNLLEGTRSCWDHVTKCEISDLWMIVFFLVLSILPFLLSFLTITYYFYLHIPNWLLFYYFIKFMIIDVTFFWHGLPRTCRFIYLVWYIGIYLQGIHIGMQVYITLVVWWYNY